MDYKKIHDAIIFRAIEREQDPFIQLGYVEKHHIIPRCMGGSNNKNNLVRLTPKEHFIVHLILHRMFPKHHGLALACRAMCMSGPNQVRNNRMYCWLKKTIAKSQNMETFHV